MADPQAALRRWIVEGLDKKGRGSSRELAKRIGIEPEVLSRMKNTDGFKETRRIDAHMVPVIAEFFGTIPPGFDKLTNLNRVTYSAPGKSVVTIENPGEQKNMPDRGKTVTVHVDPPHNSTLVIGDNNTVTTNNTQIVGGGAALSPEQIEALSEAIESVATARDAAPDDVRKELCAALKIADPALITGEIFPAAEKMLATWKEEAIRTVVNEKGGEL